MEDETPSLAGCWLKHSRAKRHIETLESILREFGDSKPYRITGKFDPEQRALIITAETLHKPDTSDWGVLLGDIVHNLRSALDHLVWQLALLSGSKTGNHLQFPIERTGAGYWSCGKKGEPSTREHRLRGVAERYRAVIDEAQPYRAGPHAGAHSLAILSYLSNVDKHRFIHPAFSAIDDKSPERARLVGNPDAGDLVEIKHELFPADGEAEVARIVFECPGPKPDVKMEGDLPLLVGFSRRRVRAKEIGVIYEDVETILDAYAPAFAAGELGGHLDATASTETDQL